jgi:6-methylsalicylate decarboxylase
VAGAADRRPCAASGDAAHALDAAGRWRVELQDEPVHEVDLRAHEPARRAALAAAEGIDVVAVCLSSPLGIEALPPAEAAPPLAAFNGGILELDAPFVLWGAVSVERPAPAAVDALLDAGAIGVSLPAAAVADAHGLSRLRPLLARLAERGAPLLVHPAAVDRGGQGRGRAAWWPAVAR